MLVVCAIIYPVSRLAGAVFQISRPNGFIKVCSTHSVCATETMTDSSELSILTGYFQSKCMRYESARSILIATPFRDLAETIKYGNVIAPIIDARNCWNPIDITVLLSSIILIGIVLIFTFIGCCAIGCKFLKKRCKSSAPVARNPVQGLRFK